MASTATNKQPLLVDRVFHRIIDTDQLVSGSTSSLDITGTNQASVVTNQISGDGALIEDIYTISRDTNAHTLLLYFATAADFLRTDALLVGKFASSTTAGSVTHWEDMPFVMAPVPQVSVRSVNTRASGQFKGLYVPKGQVLWVTRQATSALSNTGPIFGAQGGLY